MTQLSVEVRALRRCIGWLEQLEQGKPVVMNLRLETDHQTEYVTFDGNGYSGPWVGSPQMWRSWGDGSEEGRKGRGEEGTRGGSSIRSFPASLGWER